MQTATNHHQIDAAGTGINATGNHINIASGITADILPFPDLAQGTDLVTAYCSFFITHGRGCIVHPFRESVKNRIFFTGQEHLRAANVVGVFSVADQAHARRGAPPDLVQQAWPGTMLKNTVFTSAQAKNLLQQLHAFPHGSRIRERTKIPVLLVRIAAKKPQPGVPVSAQHQIRIRLVIAKQDVVARRQSLDQVVFQQQSFGLRTRHRGVDAVDLRNHQPYPRRQRVTALKIRCDTLAQVQRLADIKNFTLLADHPVNPRQMGQTRGNFRRLSHGQPKAAIRSVYLRIAANTS